MTKFKYLILFLYFLTSCAVQVPPSGGPPDTTPPVITESYPATGTLEYKKDYVQFRFSKYMNRSSVIENLFISPESAVSYTWRGKAIEINFTEKLKEDVTYSISFGTDYRDLKGNKPEMGYTMIFSTGEVIDSGRITGVLQDKNPAGKFIFAYLLDGINPDTLNPSSVKPHYRTQIGSNGLFSIEALKPGNYRIFAVDDKMKDGIYDHGIDGIGSAPNDIFVSYDSTVFVPLRTSNPIDDVGPMLYSVEALTESYVRAEFSESLDSSSVSRRAFRISDENSENEIPVVVAFLRHGNARYVDIITAEKISDTSLKWRLSVESRGEFALRDSSKNVIQDTASTGFFFASTDLDTFRLRLINTNPSDSAQNMPTQMILDYTFTAGIVDYDTSITVTLISGDGKVKINCRKEYPAENLLRIVPNILANDMSYNLSVRINTSELDTIYSLNFRTADERSYGGVRGMIVDSGDYQGQYLVILTAQDESGIYYFISRNGKFAFDKLPAKVYKIEVIKDLNSNEKFDAGIPYPWEPSELFYLIHQEIDIKPRWTIEDLIININ